MILKGSGWDLRDTKTGFARLVGTGMMLVKASGWAPRRLIPNILCCANQPISALHRRSVHCSVVHSKHSCYFSSWSSFSFTLCKPANLLFVNCMIVQCTKYTVDIVLWIHVNSHSMQTSQSQFHNFCLCSQTNPLSTLFVHTAPCACIQSVQTNQSCCSTLLSERSVWAEHSLHCCAPISLSTSIYHIRDVSSQSV